MGVNISGNYEPEHESEGVIKEVLMTGAKS
jgi:hypothetical protein